MRISFSQDRKISQFTRWVGVYFLCLILGALNLGSVGSLLKILAIIPVAIWLFKNHTIKMNYLLWNAIPFVIICAASYFWTIDLEQTSDRAVTQLLFLILILAVSGYKYNSHEIEYLKKCLIWASRISAILVLISADYLVGRIYLNSFVQEDPNYLCAYFMFAIVFNTTVLLSKSSDIKRKMLNGLELLLYMYIVLATGSRGGLFAVLVSISLVVLFYREKNQHVANSIRKRLFFVIVVFVAYFASTYFVSQDVMARFTLEAISSSNGTGRFELWQDAIAAFMHSSFSRQLFGYGSGSIISVTYLFPFHRHNVLHNIFVENLIEIGVIGALFYIAHVFSFLRKCVAKRDVYALSVLVGMVVLSLSTSLYAFKPYWNIMIFVLCLNLSEVQGDE